jgi:two-component system, NarL family, nitrate/nitrite sensor histidine kinase NarX
MRAEWLESPLKPLPAPSHVAPDASLLADITAGLSAGNDLNALLQRFLVPIMQMVGARAGAVRALSPEGDRLQMISQVGLPEHVADAERAVNPGCGACGSAFSGDAVVRTSDVRHCAHRTSDAYFGEVCQSLLAVPLTHRGEVLGVYNLFFTGGVTIADEASASFKTIGELLGLALHNARLERENLQASLLAERQAMAAEVHDSIAQTLAFVKMRMPLLESAIASGNEAQAALRYCADVREAVTTAHTNLRAILGQFRAPMDPRGLKSALAASVAAFRDSTHVALEFDDRAPALQLSPGQESQVFRIVQEALANIARHAGASRAWLGIEQNGGRVDIVVEDNGTGLPQAAPQPGASHFGLDIMRQRAARLGGTIEIGARAAGGTRVKLSFPVNVGRGAA